MDARTGLVIGGMTAVAASVAVVTAVALANTAALADSPGTSIASAHVVVPAAPTPSATPTADPAADALTPSPEPEVVPAPAPVVVDGPSEAAPVAPPAPPAPAPAAEVPAAPADPGDIGAAIAAAKAAGSWDAIRSWAVAHGWSSDRIEALVARLQRDLSDDDDRWNGRDSHGSSDSEGQWQGIQPPAKEQNPSEGQTKTSQRPAHAGSIVGDGNDAGTDGKRDQSRDFPR